MKRDHRGPGPAAAGPVDVMLPLVWPRAGSAWVDQAACVGHPDLPWTADLHLLTGRDLVEMGAVCAGCPVRSPCAGEAVTATAGFWAGQPRETGGRTDLADGAA